MRRNTIIGLLSIGLLVAPGISGQITVSPQALQLLKSALTALVASTPAKDVTLSGSVHYIAGSDDETGTATLQALADGASRVDLNLPSGIRSEVRNFASADAGSWSGPDGSKHSIPEHNLLNEPVWFFPALMLTRRLNDSDFAATYVGREVRDSVTVEHLSVYRSFPSLGKDGSLLQHLTLADLYLDATTSLPLALDYNIHPDNDAGLDIPVEVQFSDYRTVNGAQIPFHVQRFLNNGLVLDLQFQSATVNSGLLDAQFPVQ